MARVVALGTAAAVADEEHANTYLALEGEQGFLLIDCADSPLVRIRQAGLDLQRLRGLIITHFHPDHVCGIPILLMNIWLLGRTASLPVYGLPDVLERFNAMMELFFWRDWPGFFPVLCQTVEEKEGALVLDDEDFRITSAPVKHIVPALGLRIENKRTGGVLAYSGDTAPCDAMVRLARGAQILIHEIAGSTWGHSTPDRAGKIALRASVGRLVLIHYQPAPHKYDRWIEQARAIFGGPVELAQDFGEYVF